MLFIMFVLSEKQIKITFSSVLFICIIIQYTRIFLVIHIIPNNNNCNCITIVYLIFWPSVIHNDTKLIRRYYILLIRLLNCFSRRHCFKSTKLAVFLKNSVSNICTSMFKQVIGLMYCNKPFFFWMVNLIVKLILAILNSL